MSRMRTAIVGGFVLGGLLLFAGGLFLIGDRRLLFAEQFELNSTFGKVTGVRVGTQVRVAGLAAGEVLEIVLPTGPADRFGVRMRLREDLRPLVRRDSPPPSRPTASSAAHSSRLASAPRDRRRSRPATPSAGSTRLSSPI